MTTTPTPVPTAHDGEQHEVPERALWVSGFKSALTITPHPAVKSTNPALTALQTGGAILCIGGLIAMITGLTRTAPRGSAFSSAADNITSAMQFAGTSTLIVTVGGMVLLIGAMCLVGALVVAAVKAAKVTG